MIDPRWQTVLTTTPYLVLAVLTAFTIGIEWGDWSHLVPDLVLCAAVAVWILFFRDLRFPWRDKPAAIAVFLTGLILLNLALVLRDGWFGFLAIASFSFCYSIVPWPWELLAVGPTAVVAGIAQSSSFGRDPAGVVGTVTVILLNVIVMCGLSWGLRVAQQQQERVATEAERARLAREIHDTLAQGFAGIVTQLQAADQAPDEALRRRHTDAALGLARDGLAEARRSVQALRPVALDAVRLPEAIATAAHRWSERTGIRYEMSTTGKDRALPTEAEVALLRTAQEALANVESHASAQRVTVALHYDAHGARLEVRDDGSGFEPDRRPASARGTDDGHATDGDHDGYGLIAMRERIEALAGHLVVESSPGHGTAIRAEVPA